MKLPLFFNWRCSLVLFHWFEIRCQQFYQLFCLHIQYKRQPSEKSKWSLSNVTKIILTLLTLEDLWDAQKSVCHTLRTPFIRTLLKPIFNVPFSFDDIKSTIPLSLILFTFSILQEHFYETIVHFSNTKFLLWGLLFCLSDDMTLL